MANRKQVEIWDVPKKSFAVSGSTEIFRAYCISNVRGNSTVLYAWIPDYQFDNILSISNPFTKGCKYIGVADSNFNFDTLVTKLELPSIEEIDKLYNKEISAEHVNGLTNEELLVKYKPTDLADTIVKLSLQNEYYLTLINEIRNHNNTDNSQKVSDTIKEYEKAYEDFKQNWLSNPEYSSFKEYLANKKLLANSHAELDVLNYCTDKLTTDKTVSKKPRPKPHNITTGLTTASTMRSDTDSVIIETPSVTYSFNSDTTSFIPPTEEVKF